MVEELNLKQRIKADEITIGVSVPWDATKSLIEDIWSRDDEYHFIAVDSQHSPLVESQLASIFVAAQDLSIPVHFRILHTNMTYRIGNWLDLGASSIEVPQTETEATAQDAVDYFYYPQAGKRSWGGVTRVGVDQRHLKFPTDDADRVGYANWWNNFGVLMLQVESINAIENIPKLAKPGVDCVSWGPNDLAFDREAHPNHPLAASDEVCIEYAVKACNDSGIKLMIRNNDHTQREKYIEMGATVLLETPRN